jgi:hypothetical protein
MVIIDKMTDVILIGGSVSGRALFALLGDSNPKLRGKIHLVDSLEKAHELLSNPK